MDGELQVDTSQIVQSSPLIRSGIPFLTGRQNVTTTYRWSKVVTYATPELARTAQFTAATNLGSKYTGSKVATVKLYNQATPAVLVSTCTYSTTTTPGDTPGAVIESVVPVIRDSLRLTTSYVMVCGEGTITTPP